MDGQVGWIRLRPAPVSIWDSGKCRASLSREVPCCLVCSCLIQKRTEDSFLPAPEPWKPWS